MKIQILTSTSTEGHPLISMQAENFAEKCMLKILLDGMEHFGVNYFKWSNYEEEGVSALLVKKQLPTVPA